MSQSPEQTEVLASQDLLASAPANRLDLARSDRPTYSERTARIQALTQLIRAVQPLIWATVLTIVLIPLLGQYVMGRVLPLTQPTTAAGVPVEVAVATPDWSTIDAVMAQSLQEARRQAETYAHAQLTQWMGELEPRVDSFLDWYFDFFQQKAIEFSTPFLWGYGAVQHRFNPTHPSAQATVADYLTHSFEREFAQRVLVPQNAQLRLERITAQTVDCYLLALDQQLGAVQTRYRIPQGQWERYLNDISVTLGREGSLSHLSLKTLVGGGTYLAAKPLLLASLGKLSGKASTKIAGAALGKVAAKAGGTVATQLGAAILDPLVGLGILAWDVWDYRHTVASDRPILRANITSYLQDVEQVLLNHPDAGVMSAVAQVEQSLLQAL
jgi:hypothetical protein